MTNVACNTIGTSADKFTIEVDSVNQDQWHGLVAQFEDATLMQTWSYGVTRWGERKLSHVVVKKDRRVVAAAQLVIQKVPLLNAGLAYVKGGPMWQLRGTGSDADILRQVLRALRRVYEIDRGLFLRICPAVTDDGTGNIRSIYLEEGFTRDLSVGRPRTVYIDLCNSLDDLRASLKPTWRRNLVLGERYGLSIWEGTGEELVETFVTLYVEMLQRKNIIGVVDIGCYQEMQRTLPEPFKMKIMICVHQGEPVAGLAVPCLGNTGQNLLAATGDKGLSVRASYLLHWRMLEWLKGHGFRWYDLDAVNHENYQGISQFKLGFAGRLGWEAEYLGQFHACRSRLSYVSVMAADRLRERLSDIRVALNRLRYRKVTGIQPG